MPTMAMGVDSDRDTVVISFPARRQHLSLTVKWDAAGHPAEIDMAVTFARTLYMKAAEAEDWVLHGGRRTLVTAERRYGIGLSGHEIVVAFDAPAPTHKLPYETAKRLADDVVVERFKLMTKIQREAGVKYNEDHPELRDER